MAKLAKPILLQPVRPSAGIRAMYRKRLLALIDEMGRSVEYWVRARYRANPPRMAQDETPADILSREIEGLDRQWREKFDTMCERLAEYFAKSVEKRSTGTLKRILAQGGMTVKFQMTPAMRDVLNATVNENVRLIKSIPEQYLDQVEGIVMRGVQTGRDVGQVSADLQKQLGVTRRRADFIARDQNEKATSAFNRARQLELGVEEAEWVHSGGGKHPRPTHVKAGRDRVRFRIAQGWFDPAVKRYIQPGEEPNCRCTSRPIIRGFS